MAKKKKNQEKLQAKAACCTEEILKAKSDYILRMTSKLKDPNTAPKTYWSILNQFLYTINTSYLLIINLLQIFV